MITDTESRLIMVVILAGLLITMIITHQMDYYSATFGAIVGLIAPTTYLINSAVQTIKGVKDGSD